MYEESRSCLSTLTRYWSVNEVLTIDPDGESPVTDSETVDEVLRQVDLDERAPTFVEFGNSMEVGDETVLVVEMERDGRVKQTDPVTFEIVYELVEVNVND